MSVVDNLEELPSLLWAESLLEGSDCALVGANHHRLPGLRLHVRLTSLEVLEVTSTLSDELCISDADYAREHEGVEGVGSGVAPVNCLVCLINHLAEHLR